MNESKMGQENMTIMERVYAVVGCEVVVSYWMYV